MSEPDQWDGILLVSAYLPGVITLYAYFLNISDRNLKQVRSI